MGSQGIRAPPSREVNLLNCGKWALFRQLHTVSQETFEAIFH